MQLFGSGCTVFFDEGSAFIRLIVVDAHLTCFLCYIGVGFHFYKIFPNFSYIEMLYFFYISPQWFRLLFSICCKFLKRWKDSLGTLNVWFRCENLPPCIPKDFGPHFPHAVVLCSSPSGGHIFYIQSTLRLRGHIVLLFRFFFSSLYFLKNTGFVKIYVWVCISSPPLIMVIIL